MNSRLRGLNKQAGSMVLEALISIVIFSVGILGLVGLLSATTNKAGDAKYRADASLLANQLIGQMWGSDRTQTVLQNNFSSPAGQAYVAWASQVASALPGVTAALMPTVAISSVNATAVPSSYVTITMQWKAPNDAHPHRYVSIAQIL